MLFQLIAEATECDYKEAVEAKKPKSWLKSVSAFANGIGGTLLFGVADERTIIGLPDVQHDAEVISEKIKDWPLRKFCVSDIRQNQEYHIIHVHIGGLYPMSTSFPGGWDGMRAVCGVNAITVSRES